MKVARTYKLSTEFFAADGHYGTKSDKLVKHYAEDLGFEYLSASNKKEFLKKLDEFTKDSCNKPILFEVFTNEKDESDALEIIYNLEHDAKSVAKKIIGKNGERLVRRMMGK